MRVRLKYVREALFRTLSNRVAATELGLRLLKLARATKGGNLVDITFKLLRLTCMEYQEGALSFLGILKKLHVLHFFGKQNFNQEEQSKGKVW